MISCTEFIPAYSELFSYIDDNFGKAEVERFWDYLFTPDGNGIPLINHIEKEGIKGCYTYWAGSLNEEAADFAMYLNEKAGWFMIDMRYCPSKGRLLKLKDEIGLTPYPDYCMHCDHYRAAAEKCGLEYQYDFIGTDHASCRLAITDPKRFDGRFIPDENTVMMERKAENNEYFHPDFHSSMNMGIHYLGEHFGIKAVEGYLSRYVKNVYCSYIEDIGSRGISAVEKMIKATYEKEKAPEAVSFSRREKTLTVDISFCPAVRHLRNTGRQVSPWFRYTTETVMKTVAEISGISFVMLRYDEDTGAACFEFTDPERSETF